MYYQPHPISSDMPAVLAVHGSASSGAQWQPLIDQLDGQRIVLAPDLPGYGPAAEADIQAMPDRFGWLSDVMKSVGGPFDLIGHSFGGAVALMLANRNPHMINSVALYEPVVPVVSEQNAENLIEQFRGLWKLMRRLDPAAAMQVFCDFWSHPGHWSNPSEKAHINLARQYQVVMHDFAQAFGGELHHVNGRFKGPMTILQGSESPSVAGAMSQVVARQYPQARMLVLKGLGHLAPMTVPDIVNPVLLDCLEQHAPSPTQSFQKLAG